MLRLIEHTLRNNITPLLLRAMLQQELIPPSPRIAIIRVQDRRFLEPRISLLKLALRPENPRGRDEQDRVIVCFLNRLEDARFALRARFEVPDALAPDEAAGGAFLQGLCHFRVGGG
jgi:hypothetical protein